MGSTSFLSKIYEVPKSTEKWGFQFLLLVFNVELFFIVTNGVRSYQISVKLAKPTTEFTDRPGDMYVTIEGTKNNYEFKLSTKAGELIHGATYSFLASNKEDLGKMKGLTFKWNSKSWMSFIKTHYIYLDYVKVTPMNIVDKATRDKMTKKFCYPSKTAIASKKNAVLVECS